MADTRRLQFIIDAENRTSKAFGKVNESLNTVHGKLEKMKPTFQKMAVAGGLAFGAISLVVKNSVNEVAKAEGAYNKFNTVFGEHKDDMIDFVGEIRKTMPTATSEIVRMAADLQDLLVPLGLSRGLATDMSKGFLDVANKIAAFNDVEPTAVLEAIKSGLSGSSEPLRRYGVNALETALEARALEEGLMDVGESFKNLDPEVKTQIRAQALLAQIIDNSSDAIEGFEANNDSFIRRQQELNATITETKEKIGEALIPMFDSLLKKILPVVEKITDWIGENPELTKVIIIVAAALAGLVTVLGLLGLILPAIITGFGLLFSPVTLIILGITALIAVGVLVVKNWEMIKAKAVEVWSAIAGFFVGIWKSITDAITTAWNGIKNFFSTIWEAIQIIIIFYVTFMVGLVIAIFDAFGIDIIKVFTDIKEFFVAVWDAIKTAFDWALTGIKLIWESTWGAIADFISPIWEKIKTVVAIGWGWLKNKFAEATKPLSDAWNSMWQGMTNAASSAWEGVKNVVKSSINWIIEKINSFINSVNSVAQKGASVVGASAPQIPNIPLLANGGIVTRPTLAMIGEGGPEAVIPLRRGMAGAGMGNITINITGNEFMGEEGIADRIGDQIMRTIKDTIKL